MIVSFDNIVVGDDSKTGINCLVIAADKELPEPGIQLGALVPRGVGVAVVEPFQGCHRDDMGEALEQDGCKEHCEAGELYDEMRLLVHGLESEIDERVEIGNT